MLHPSLAAQPWALQAEYLRALLAMPPLEAIEAARPMQRARARRGAIAVLPIHGPIEQRASFLGMLLGGTSIEGFRDEFRSAVTSEDVRAIVLDVDSPGGSVYGVAEMAAEIHVARGRKPLVAVANSLMASAAYHLASAADEVVASPSSEVGSIGVLYVHEDVSQALESMGVKPTVIRSGRYKGEGNPYEPLSEEARDHIQARSDEYYSLFVDAIAKHRGVKSADVRAGYGEGRVVGAQEAVRVGLADRVATFDQVIARLGGTSEQQPKAPPAAELAALWHIMAGQSRDLAVATRTLED